MYTSSVHYMFIWSLSFNRCECRSEILAIYDTAAYTFIHLIATKSTAQATTEESWTNDAFARTMYRVQCDALVVSVNRNLQTLTGGHI